jgi:hypothetical protein
MPAIILADLSVDDQPGRAATGSELERARFVPLRVRGPLPAALGTRSEALRAGRASGCWPRPAGPWAASPSR